MPSSLPSLYIVNALRSAIAKPHKGLKNVTVTSMTAAVIKELIVCTRINPNQVDEVIVGNAVGAGAGQNFPRAAALAAGLPESVPAYRVGNVCASGTEGLIAARRAIFSGQVNCVIVAAAESATASPALSWEEENEPVSSLQLDGLRCSMTGRLMGELCEATARQNKISREEQDKYAFFSHQKALAAQAAGNFASEIVGVADGETNFNEDEYPRKNISPERLAALPPAFSVDGTITAGNACAPGDGACGLVLVSENFLKENSLKPLAVLKSVASYYVKPEAVFTAGAEALRKAAKDAGWKISDVDLFEFCEAFAAQAILAQTTLGIEEARWNVGGGDIALGHPLGAAGLRGVVTLVHSLHRRQLMRGLSCASFGGGGALAVGVETAQ